MYGTGQVHTQSISPSTRNSISTGNQMTSTPSPYLWCAPYISNILTGSNYTISNPVISNPVQSPISNPVISNPIQSQVQSPAHTLTTSGGYSPSPPYPSQTNNGCSGLPVNSYSTSAQRYVDNQRYVDSQRRQQSQNVQHSSQTNVTVKPMKIVKELGRGSYGKVYEVADSEGERYAVKIIPNLNNGPPDVLEASIMSTINHPGIAKAVSISLTDKKMCIFQRLARSDLAHYCTPENYVGGPLLKSWTSTLIQAVSCLHQERIIHCDIKASNVLLYHDNNIAITDFTLSVLNLGNNYYDHDICTVTHRPPECFLDKKWSYPVDVWSLALTLYELATGQLLIPFQGEDLVKMKEMDREVKKKTLNSRTIAAIMHWMAERGEVTYEDASKYNIQFIPVKYCPAWEATSQEFKNMVLSMLRYKPEDRPTATELLTCDYLEGVKLSEYYNLSTPAYDLDSGDQRLLERMSATYDLESETVAKTKELYSRCIREGMVKDLTLVIGCIWVASKVTHGDTPRVSMPLIQVLEKEREICRVLKYRLHTASMDAIVEVY